MKRREILLFSILAGASLMLATGCMPGTDMYSSSRPAGFFSGVWHGWIAPLSLIAGLFRGAIRVYEADNTGWWYDFGFYMAVISGFGGLSLLRRNRDEEPKE